MNLPDLQLLLAFGPLGTPELVVIGILFLMFGGLTAAVVAMAIYYGRRSPSRPPPPNPQPPELPAKPPSENDG